MTTIDDAFVPAEYSWLERRLNIDSSSLNTSIQSLMLSKLGSNNSTLQILDLGAGFGANIFHLAPKFNCRQNWTLLDRDPKLIEKVNYFVEKYFPKNSDTKENSIKIRNQNIRYNLVNMDMLDLSNKYHKNQFDLVTANAVFDLISTSQFRKLVDNLVKLDLYQLYFSINLDKDIELFPLLENDFLVIDTFKNHMVRKQSFGRAMGSDSCEHMTEILNDNGYKVYSEPSNWEISTNSINLQLDLIKFFRSAAQEMLKENNINTNEMDLIAINLDKRIQLINHSDHKLIIFHQDIFAYQ